MRVLLQDEQFGKAVTSLAFDPRGRLMAIAEDGTFRVYDPDFGHATTVALPPGAHPYGVAVSPDGKHIAVGDRERPVVHMFGADRLRLERDLEGGPRRAGSLNVAAFSPDGRALFAGGSYVDESGTLYIRRWSLPGGIGTDLPVARDLITDLLPLPDGVLFTTAEPSIGRLGNDGQVTALLRSRHIDFHNAGRTGFRLSADGARIRLPINVSAGPVILPSEQAIVADVRARTIDVAGNDAGAFAPPYAAAGGLAITEWQNGHNARLNGQLIGLQDSEKIRAVAVQLNGAGAALGTDFFVRFVTRQGEAWRQPTGTPAWAVNVSADGRWVVAGLGDGTVRWYQAQDGRPVLTLFVDPPTGRFVVWTPEGFFDHDHRADGQPDGRSLIGYRFNLPNGRASNFVAIGQLYPRFFRPDLVGLAFRDDPAARRILADQSGLEGTTRVALAEGLPPSVTLLEACALGPTPPPTGCAGQTPLRLDAMSAVPTDTLRLRYRLSDPAGHVGSVVLSRNNAVVRPDTVIESADETNRIEQATFALGRGRSVVALTPLSNTGAVEAATTGRVTLTLDRVPAIRGAPATADSPAAMAERPAPTLYVLSVGVSDTANPDWKLRNPINDAKGIAAQMQKPAPSVYSATDVVTLVDPDSTAEGILAALHRIALHATPDDLVMIYLAGHGRTVDGRYYFAPHDMGVHNPDLLARIRTANADPSVPEADYDSVVDVLYRTEGLSQEQLLAAIQNIQANRIALVLDTCYSATVADQDTVLRRDVNTTVTNRIGHASGRFVLSGSFAGAYDSANGSDSPTEADGHGLFTSVLLRALRGEADTDRSGRIDIYKLATFTKHNVEQESAQLSTIQEPAYYFAGNDFFALH
jgi:uncharacterized caspase-like protein/WD40 repeat protein